MLYAIYALDVPDSAERRAASRPAHLERVKAMHAQGRLAMVGPLPRLDAPSVEGGVAGSLIIAEFDSLEDARAWIQADPYVAAGVYASIDVRPFLKLNL